jgi:hypothetical protein
MWTGTNGFQRVWPSVKCEATEVLKSIRQEAVDNVCRQKCPEQVEEPAVCPGSPTPKFANVVASTEWF